MLSASMASSSSQGFTASSPYYGSSDFMSSSPFTSIHSSSPFTSTNMSSSVENDFCTNFSCCGLNLVDLHELLEHFEETHVTVFDQSGRAIYPTASSSGSNEGPQAFQSYAAYARSNKLPTPSWHDSANGTRARYSSRVFNYPRHDSSHDLHDDADSYAFDSPPFTPESESPPSSPEMSMALANLSVLNSPSPTALLSSRGGDDMDMDVMADFDAFEIAPVGLPPSSFMKPSSPPHSFARSQPVISIETAPVYKYEAPMSTEEYYEQQSEEDDEEYDEEEELIPVPSNPPPSLPAYIPVTAPVQRKKSSHKIPDTPTKRSSKSAANALNRKKRDKMYKCPKEGCVKAYLNKNGLKYHSDRGTCRTIPVPLV